MPSGVVFKFFLSFYLFYLLICWEFFSTRAKVMYSVHIRELCICLPEYLQWLISCTFSDLMFSGWSVVVGTKWELKEISSATSHSDWLYRHDALPAAGVETCLIKKGSFNVLVVVPNSFYFQHVFWCHGRSLCKRITTHSMMKNTKLTHSVDGIQHSEL